ncbi:Uncharacterised protein [Vibrio cholerae]|nr:Uncharacterised protein [Vibrio cholerae]CSD47522.1 Uncharacterised protein [Vibrio cholerae]
MTEPPPTARIKSMCWFFTMCTALSSVSLVGLGSTPENSTH